MESKLLRAEWMHYYYSIIEQELTYFEWNLHHSFFMCNYLWTKFDTIHFKCEQKLLIHLVSTVPATNLNGFASLIEFNENAFDNFCTNRNIDIFSCLIWFRIVSNKYSFIIGEFILN